MNTSVGSLGSSRTDSEEINGQVFKGFGKSRKISLNQEKRQHHSALMIYSETVSERRKNRSTRIFPTTMKRTSKRQVRRAQKTAATTPTWSGRPGSTARATRIDPRPGHGQSEREKKKGLNVRGQPFPMSNSARYRCVSFESLKNIKTAF